MAASYFFILVVAVGLCFPSNGSADQNKCSNAISRVSRSKSDMARFYCSASCPSNCRSVLNSLNKDLGCCVPAVTYLDNGETLREKFEWCDIPVPVPCSHALCLVSGWASIVLITFTNFIIY